MSFCGFITCPEHQRMEPFEDLIDPALGAVVGRRGGDPIWRRRLPPMNIFNVKNKRRISVKTFRSTPPRKNRATKVGVLSLGLPNGSPRSRQGRRHARWRDRLAGLSVSTKNWKLRRPSLLSRGDYGRLETFFSKGDTAAKTIPICTDQVYAEAVAYFHLCLCCLLNLILQ